MTEAWSVSPIKVHVLRADATDADVEDVIQSPDVQFDPSRRSLRVSGGDRVEEGNIVDGELVASARGLKVTCGGDGEERRSLHLAFSDPAELDQLVDRLEGAGLSVLRSQDDPNFKTKA